jgi:predicted DNA-binding transcriptional regulator AlpA
MRKIKIKKKFTKADIEGKRLLGVPETAWYLDISPQTIYNGICKGSANPFPVKPVRRGRFVKFDRAEIDQYIDSLLASREGGGASG